MPKLTIEQAEEQGFTVDTYTYPHFGYKGSRFSPDEYVMVYTELEAKLIVMTDPTVLNVLDQWVEYGELGLDKHHTGYFSKGGHAATVLKKIIVQLRGALPKGHPVENTQVRWVCAGCALECKLISAHDDGKKPEQCPSDIGYLVHWRRIN